MYARDDHENGCAGVVLQMHQQTRELWKLLSAVKALKCVTPSEAAAVNVTARQLKFPRNVTSMIAKNVQANGVMLW